MTIRIIEEKPDPSVVKQRVCYNCGVKMEYLPADVEQRKATDYTGDSEIVRFINCPGCKVELRIR